MSWFKSLFKKELQQAAPQAATTPSIEFAIDALMRKLCDVDACVPSLTEAGVSEVAFWRVYNLTVIACSMRFLEKVLSQSQLPRFYIMENPDGTDEEIMFRMCEIYSKARTMLSRYGQGDVIVASLSAQVQAMNWCLNQLGDSPTTADKAVFECFRHGFPLSGKRNREHRSPPKMPNPSVKGTCLRQAPYVER
jgi:hypothetical protein